VIFSRVMINILYLHETPELSGAENSLLNLAVRLDKLKFRAAFAVSGEGSFVSKLKEYSLSVTSVGFPRIFNIFAFCGSLRMVMRLVREREIAIIHSNSIRTHLYSFIAGRLCGVSVIWHERNLITDEMIDPDRLLYLLPDRIICNSRAIADRFLKKGRLPEKAVIVYNGVDTDRFNPDIKSDKVRKEFGVPSDGIVIGIASRFNAIKGHETFFRAAKMLLERMSGQGRPLRFLVAGGAVFDADRSREKTLREDIRALNIDKDVVFTGFRTDMPEVYAAMDIFVLPSHYEGCSRVLLESMACAKPVVATNLGGTTEVVEDSKSGLLIRPGDPAGMAEKIASLISDPIGAKKMGLEARRRVLGNFRIERNVRDTERVYEEVVRHHYHEG